MKLKTIFKEIMFFSAILCATACFLCCFNIPMHRASANNYDYSCSDDKYTLDARDLFLKEIGEPNALESEYIDTLDYKLSYSDNQEKENIVTSFIDDKLYVFAYESKTVGNNDKDVKWVPKSYTYKNVKYNFEPEGDHYVGIIENYDENINDIKVDYYFDAELEKEDAEKIFNGAYNYGKEQSDRKDVQIAEYEAARTKYEQYFVALDDYNQNKIDWAEYEAANEAYGIYLDKYNVYLEKYEKYQANKEAWDQYNADYAKYTKYLNDLEYYNEHHEQNLIDYENFYPNYQKFEYRLKAMDLIYKDMAPMNRNIYSQIMGDSVTQVLNRKSDLVALGVSEDLIDEAYKATLELRIIFETYKTRETDSQKYAYYKNNYSMIKTNVEDLLRSLDKLYRSALVPEAIGTMGSDKTEKYLNLVAQLAYLANAIDDKDVYNYEGWNGVSGSLNRNGAKIIDDSWLLIGKTWKEYLAGEEFLDVYSSTLKAYPAEAKFPTEVVELLVEPEPVEEPTAPTEILAEPVAPTFMEQPVPPAEKLEKPEQIDEPNINDYLVSTEKEYIYAEAYKTGELVKRREIGEVDYIRFETSATVNISQKIKKVCRFLNYDGTYLSQDIFTNYPKYIGETPFKEQDETYNDYLFEGWNDLNDNNVLLENVNASCSLKARFLGRNLDKFDITFIIGDRTETITSAVGYLPTLPSDISLPETDEHFYVFSGWDKELQIVNKAETYIAQFEQKNKYLIEFDIDGTIVSQMVKEGELPTPPEKVEKEDGEFVYYVFEDWDKELEIVTKPEKYTAIFAQKDLILVGWIYDSTFELEKYKPNEIVTYKNGIPYKESDDTYYYEFVSWDRELGFEATENTLITATFEAKHLKNVTWLIGDQIIKQSFKEDEYIDAPKVSATFDECYIYTFAGFDLLQNSSTYNLFYRAKFATNYILYSDNAGVRVQAQNNIINIYLDDRKDIDLAPLFELFEVGYEIGDIRIIGNSYTINISKLQLQYLINKGFTYISLDFKELENGEYTFKVNVLDENRTVISNIDNVVISLELDGNFDYLRSYVFLNDAKQNAEITQKSILLDAKPNVEYGVFPVYSVTVLENEGGEIICDTISGRIGTEISLEYILKPGYTFKNYVISDTNVEVCNTDGKYTIKGYDITIGMSTERIMFTIKFYVDDELYVTSYVYYGDKIVAPDYATKQSTETTRYIFDKWDKNVAEAYQNEDFHAIFTEVEIPKIPVNHGLSIITVVEIIAISAVSVGLVVVLLIIFRKKIFRRH